MPSPQEKDDSRLHPIRFGGQVFVLDGRRALWWPKEKTLIVSDLHLGKGQSYGKHATLLPPYDTADTLTRLAQLLAFYQPARVLSLGDSFHRRDSLENLPDPEWAALGSCVKAVPEWLWVAGNHDPEPPEGIGGKVVECWAHGGITFRHEPQGVTGPTVIGHFHPKAWFHVHNKRMNYPCFAWNETLLVMPSFGTYTGGLDVRDEALAGLLGEEMQLACTGRACEIIRAEKMVFG